NVGQAGGNVIGQPHVGGQVGTAVGQGDGEGDKLGDDGCRVVHRLGHDQVGAWRRFGGAGAVVGGVWVELVGVVDPGHIGQGVGAVHPCQDLQGLGRVSGHPAHGPEAGEAVIAPAGGRRQEGQAGGQHVHEGNAGGGV